MTRRTTPITDVETSAREPELIRRLRDQLRTIVEKSC